jgi:hypothetical protein
MTKAAKADGESDSGAIRPQCKIYARDVHLNNLFFEAALPFA